MSKDIEPRGGETLGQYIGRMRQRRGAKGWAPADLAARTHLSGSTISRLEADQLKKRPDADTLAVLASALQVPLGTLYRLAHYPGFTADMHAPEVIANFEEPPIRDRLSRVRHDLRDVGLAENLIAHYCGLIESHLDD